MSRNRSETSLIVQLLLLTLVHGYGRAIPSLSPHLPCSRAVPRDLSRDHTSLRDYVLVPCSPANQYHSAHRLLLAQQNQKCAHCTHHTGLRCEGFPRDLTARVRLETFYRFSQPYPPGDLKGPPIHLSPPSPLRGARCFPFRFAQGFGSRAQHDNTAYLIAVSILS